MAKIVLSFFLVCGFTAVSLAADTPSAQDKVSAAVQSGVAQVESVLSQTRLVRGHSEYFAALNYAPVDLILPSKWGLSLGLVNDADHTWELEYLKSSVSVPFFVEDIGEMTDERFSLIGRNYFGTESFNLSYGLSYYRFKVHIGSKYLASVATNVPDVDLMRVDALGFNLGLGHRWIFSNRWMVGLDWIAWSQPVVTTRKNNKFEDYSNDNGYRDTVDTAIKLITWVPRITVLKLQVGYSF